jgi:hypothetical protein
MVARPPSLTDQASETPEAEAARDAPHPERGLPLADARAGAAKWPPVILVLLALAIVLPPVVAWLERSRAMPIALRDRGLVLVGLVAVCALVSSLLA